jgi:serine/threonine protein kinase
MSRAAPSDKPTEAYRPRKPTPPLRADPAASQLGAYPFLLPPAEDGEIGRLGNYRVFRLLGSGGMGMVFAAEDIALRRPVALKVMNPELACDPINGWQRFLREARALAAIRHPNLVGVYQAGQEGDTVYLAMELLRGETLDVRLMRDAPLEPAEVVRIAGGVADGLAALHGQGLIHRDIKPGNIWLEAPGDRVRILDLGLVRVVHEDTHLTETGAVVGTPAYMSPEQVRGLATDHRTDLFSFGCVLYALCTGRPPFDADSALAQAAALAADDPVPVRELNPAVPEPLSALVSDLLAKNPDHRPASAAEVIGRLKAVFSKAAPTLAASTLGSLEPKRTRKSGRRSKPGGKSKAKSAGKSERQPFLRRHAVKLVALLWLVAAALGVAVLLSNRGRPASKEPDPPDAAAAPASRGKVTKEPDVLFLTDLTPLAAVGWPTPVPPPGFDGTVRVGGELSRHGIFLHPPPPFEPPASITYKLGKGYSRFAAGVAINDSAPPFGAPVIFTVYGDGKPRWKSKDVTRQGPPQACDLDVRGVNELTIEVTCPDVPIGAHAVWVEPRLVK